MALQFFDGFELFNDVGSVAGRRWDVGSSGRTGPGRYSAHSWAVGTITKTFGSHTTWIIGFALNADGGTSQPFFVANSLDSDLNPTPQLSLKFTNSLGQPAISATVGSTTSVFEYAYPTMLWQYIEVKITPTATYVRIEGMDVWLGPPISTPVSQFEWLDCHYRIGGQTLLDDVYVCDGTGTDHNDWLGDINIMASLPTGLGLENDYQPAYGTDHVAMTNIPYTDFSESGRYNYSGTVGAMELYAMAPFTVRGAPLGVNVHAVHVKDSIDLRNAAVIMRCQDTDFAGTPQFCYTYYRAITNTFPLNPVTGDPWTLDDVNALQAGIEIAS